MAYSLRYHCAIIAGRLIPSHRLSLIGYTSKAGLRALRNSVLSIRLICQLPSAAEETYAVHAAYGSRNCDAGLRAVRVDPRS
jgi:hypothetical protein